MNWLRNLRRHWLIRTRLTDAGIAQEAARSTAIVAAVHEDQEDT